jgi:hypothetical protein
LGRAFKKKYYTSHTVSNNHILKIDGLAWYQFAPLENILNYYFAWALFLAVVA